MFLKIHRFLTSISLSITLSVSTALPLSAAERLFFILGPLNLSLGIESLEEFAQTGEVNQDLGFYFRVANANVEQQTAFREALNKRVELENPVYIARFFNSSLGEDLLNRMGYLFQIQGGRNGKFAIRGALITAALDKEEGLTLMNFLRQLPTNMQFDLEGIQSAARLIEQLDQGTRLLTEEMQRLSTEAAKNESFDFSSLPDLNQAGNYGVSARKTWTLTDPKRNRTFNAIVYQPQRWRGEKTPVIIISHGLASRPEDFDHWGQHLASYGYLAVLPQHIGSDSQQIEALLTGLSREVFDIDEFINRPLDVSYVIDELERRNQAEFAGRLQLNKVGVAGHSFGGYNMLALGGATLNFDHLETVCRRDQWSVNVALLLQCRALDLSPQARQINLKDERVKAILTLNPVAGDIFGAEGLKNLKIPVAFAAGSSDPATPAAIEQLRAFVWAGSEAKYLALVRGQAHVNFTRLDAQTQAMFDGFEHLTFPKQDILDKYANIYTIAFFERHLLGDEAFAPYLTSAYSQYISRSPNEIYVVDQRADEALSQLFNRHRPSDRPPIFPPNRN
ncbi:MAG: alpha/beta hydrolase [Microcystaceae cyanobacterium]